MNARRSAQKLLSALFILFLLSGVLFPAIQAYAAEKETRYVSVDWLNLRTGPGFTYQVARVLEYGQAVEVLAKSAGDVWTNVSLSGGSEGWVYSLYLQVEKPSQGTNNAAVDATVDADRLNLRLGPGFGYKVVKILDLGQKVVAQGRSTNGDWLLVRLPDGTQGWVYSFFIRMDTEIASLPVMEAYGGPTGSGTDAKPSYNVLVTIENNQASVEMLGFPVDKKFTVGLGLPGEAADKVVASGKIGQDGSAKATFEMPKKWSNGNPVKENSLLVTLSAEDGSFTRQVNIQYYR